MTTMEEVIHNTRRGDEFQKLLSIRHLYNQLIVFGATGGMLPTQLPLVARVPPDLWGAFPGAIISGGRGQPSGRSRSPLPGSGGRGPGGEGSQSHVIHPVPGLFALQGFPVTAVQVQQFVLCDCQCGGPSTLRT